MTLISDGSEPAPKAPEQLQKYDDDNRLLYCPIVVALVKPLGWYMTRVLDERQTPTTIPGSSPGEPARRGRAIQCRERIAWERLP
jgi:hypothetical protein